MMKLNIGRDEIKEKLNVLRIYLTITLATIMIILTKQTPVIMPRIMYSINYFLSELSILMSISRRIVMLR